ncbi:hypothetical protein KKG41_02580 [Patescibacteria group bacterium]|nr:hypothetical protein [Patescibacteria group bacterium]MBU1890887.1 hypothetical protein [Patescibacteria group bacterium]
MIVRPMNIRTLVRDWNTNVVFRATVQNKQMKVGKGGYFFDLNGILCKAVGRKGATIIYRRVDLSGRRLYQKKETTRLKWFHVITLLPLQGSFIG